MNKHYIVIQDGMKDCGCACLLSIIRYYGGNVPVDMLLKLTNTTKDGTNFYEISRAANEIGLSAQGYKLANFENLREYQIPFICQIIINNYKHFIVVYKITNNHLVIMDPAKGIVKYHKNDFFKLWTGYILTLMPYKKLPFLEENDYLNITLKKFLKEHKSYIINIVILTIISSIMTIGYSYYFKVIIDNYQNENGLRILIITIAFIAVIMIKGLLEYLRNYVLITFNRKIDIELISITLKKIIHLPYSYYKNKTTGEMIARINDLFCLKNVITKLIMSVFLDAILAILVLIVLLMINRPMTYMLLIIVVAYFLIFISYKHKQEKITDALQITNANTNSYLVEALNSYETIKGLTIENIMAKKAIKKYQEYITNNSTLNSLFNDKSLLNDLISGIIISFLIYYGINNVTNFDMTLGTLLTYYTLIFYFLTPVRNLCDFYQDVYYAKNSIRRVNNLLNYKYERIDENADVVFKGHIVINKLMFSYYKNRPILRDITIDIKTGDKILLLGSTGSGKSTLLKLLYRYYEVERNKIYIDDIDISDYSLSTIRNNIAYLSQNEWLYNDTIKNNIILGRSINDLEFEKICKITHVDDIVKNKPLSYDTILEENGINLSGGERQRIILARALLKKASIILIDEGLNQIDASLERKILKSIFNEEKNKTIIIVSHRSENRDMYTKTYKLYKGDLQNDC